MNLFILLMDSGLVDISEKGLLEMYEKFKMGENDQEAERHFLLMIAQSTQAKLARLWDRTHIIASSLRSIS